MDTHCCEHLLAGWRRVRGEVKRTRDDTACLQAPEQLLVGYIVGGRASAHGAAMLRRQERVEDMDTRRW